MFLLLAGIVSDAFVSGSQTRANFYVESKKERKKKNRYAYTCFLIGAPNILVALVLTFLYM
ncbi:DUF5316 domain-containing protein [Campylobacter jejuni]|uniref:DUF5316 domain-containing protein n=1 Tax=Campylobacter jejuni TaxID=197 RepID=UPI0021FC848E|nr:hypothetical protein FORC84_p007 [Campylobacter jejuni]